MAGYKFIEELLNIKKDTFNIATGLVISYEDKYLFSIQNKEKWRTIDNKYNIGLVGIGGGLENNETIIECLQRECLEEIGQKVILQDSKETFLIDEDMSVKMIDININNLYPRPYYISKIKNSNGKYKYPYTITISYKTNLKEFPNFFDIHGLVLIDKQDIPNIDINGMDINEWNKMNIKIISNEIIPNTSKLIPFGTFKSFITISQLLEKK